MTTVSLRFDDKMKKELDELCEELGMNLTTFFTIYAKKALRERKIPFEISASRDPFYSESNMRRIREAEEQIRQGKVVIKTMEELEAMANE
ncbi:MAG: type II toxin-antitoxin system RelB/DinJ family antitoxin [Agathobacter sp.]|nr:type II toxin-antitoxin system RelB/DinJ family antitoxin [Agathobacter sp.]